MTSQKKRYTEMNQKLIEQIDKLLKTGDWEKSLFLKAYKKKFLAIREQAQSVLNEIEKLQESSGNSSHRLMEKPGYRKVYISLYQAQGKNLQQWEQLLLGLSKHSINRPVYAEESHVKALIKNKSDPSHEAYAVVLIDEKSIIKAYTGRKVTDRLGNELLTIKENVIKVEHIIEFIHDQKHYHFADGRLQLKSNFS